jgi:pyrroline-5-carboxylate reductase
MLADHTIALLGCGNIGGALLGGLRRQDDLPAERLRATRKSPGGRAELAARYPGVVVSGDNRAAVSGASVVLLGVKPWAAREVLAEVRDALAPGALVVSVVAGLTTRSIEEVLEGPWPVVRTMPNTPALVDEGATAIVGGRHAQGEHLALARHIFEAVGKVEEVAEGLLDAVTGLSGSGPAYVYMVIEALTDGGVKQGIPRPVALRLAAQTVYGAAKLVIETGKHPAILRDEVTTPGGTAIAAVADLESHGLRTMLINAVGVATARSRELARPEGEGR